MSAGSRIVDLTGRERRWQNRRKESRANTVCCAAP